MIIYLHRRLRHSVDVSSIVSLFFTLAGFQKIVPKLGKERKLLLEKKSFGAEHEHGDNFDLGAWFWWCTCLRKLLLLVVANLARTQSAEFV